LAGSTTKKVLIRRFERETLAGYVNPLSFQQPVGVEVLSVEGNLTTVPYAEIHSVRFVRDFAAAAEPERRTFNTRPKMEGLWVSLRCRNGEVLEGVMPNNLLQLEPYGVTIIPPDPYSNTQRIFVPKVSLLAAEVLGVVGSPLKRRKAKPVPPDQIGLFDQ
jgi:uncharacterized protein DUF6982